jgi:hypothetical protein
MRRKIRKTGEKEKKDLWDKARILGSIFTAFLIAFGAIMGSIFIPDKINRNSLESQKIIQLSGLVPQLYDTTKALHPTIIAMASYGAPAVSFLLLALDDAIENEKTELINTIISTMKYMDNDSKNEICERFKLEIDQLDERSLTEHNLQYIGYLVSILECPRLGDKSKGILKNYFSVVSDFKGAQYKLKELNGVMLKALFKNGFTISELKLDSLNFAEQDLRNINFSNASLIHTNLKGTKLYDCDFSNAILDSCILYEAEFFKTNKDTLIILNIFENFKKSHWKKAKLDNDILSILVKLEKEPPNQDELLELATIAKENRF